MDSLLLRIIFSVKLMFGIHEKCILPSQQLLFGGSILALILLLWLSLTAVLRPSSVRLRTPESAKLPLPPGTYGWPIIGETLRLKRSASKPEEFVQYRMQQFSKSVFKTSLLGERVAVLCGPAGNKLLFSANASLLSSWWPRSTRSIFPLSIVAGHGPRGLLTSFLRPDHLRRIVGAMDSVARAHLDAQWASRGQRRLSAAELVKSYTFAVACRVFAGIGGGDADLVSRLQGELEVVASGVLQVPVRLPGTSYYRAMRAAETIRRALAAVVESRRAERWSSAEDLASFLLGKREEDGAVVSEEEIVDNILLLLFAGHDTTSCAITLVMKNLAEMPHIYAEVLREQQEIADSKKDGDLLNWDDIQKMKYSWNVINETLRLSPPVSGAFREATSDITFAGFGIPKGWKLFWSSYTTHRNPNYFPAPEKFDPARFCGDGPMPFTFVPFGGGPRMCPGKEFARLEMLAFLHNLVRKFRWEAVFPEEKVVVQDGMPRPLEGLPIILHPHII